MKMSDVFYGDVSPKYIDNESISELSNGENSGNDWTIQDANFWLATNKEHAEYASHAINMHDELVKSLDEMCGVWRLVCNSNGWDENHMSQYENAIKLLEHCK